MSFIESVLQRLLVPDSAVIKQATKQLLEYFVSEKCIFGLFDVLKTSQDKQVPIFCFFVRLLLLRSKNFPFNFRTGFMRQHCSGKK